jgi:hypothetical protein
MASQQRFTIRWFAIPPSGADIVGYRWVLDPEDVYDGTSRVDDSDVHHWSRQDSTTSVTLGPFTAGPKGSSDLLYVEAEDTIGNRSLGILNLVTIDLRFNRELLIVDDTRLKPDQLLATGCVDRPRGLWPSAAELDTFLYARGGVDWQCYPPGTLSSPGLFSGYSYDTLGTRGLPTIPLSKIGKYRHVIWYTDGLSATSNKPPTDPVAPITSLRYMSGPGRVNAFAAYVCGGGSVWLAGGGIAYASQIPWDDVNNNLEGTVFSKKSPRHELEPGRFMYDLAAWQSEIRVIRGTASVSRFTGRFGDSASTAGPGSPYASIPASLDAKSPGTDPLPPFRTGSDFYQQQFDLEFLQLENQIIEDVDPGEATDLQSTLDSLFVAQGPALPTDVSPICMTYYHGPSHAPVVFSGINFWSFQGSQCQGLVNFVLQNLWHLPPVAPVGIAKAHRGVAARIASGSGPMRARARELRPARRAR